MAMRLLGNIQGRELLILLDSGSSSTFVSVVVSATLSGAATLP
jgi:F0F1-type ATP synthase membrane subunit a